MFLNPIADISVFEFSAGVLFMYNIGYMLEYSQNEMLADNPELAGIFTTVMYVLFNRYSCSLVGMLSLSGFEFSGIFYSFQIFFALMNTLLIGFITIIAVILGLVIAFILFIAAISIPVEIPRKNA